MSGSIEQYTPSKYIEMAREVMGSIDLDPASCDEANRTVKARQIYTMENSALENPWECVGANVWMNPPYSRGLIDRFVDYFLMAYIHEGMISGITLTNVSTSSRWGQKLMDAASLISYPDHRISFIQSDTGLPKKGNDRDQMFCYFGNDPERFEDIFSKIGIVK